MPVSALASLLLILGLGLGLAGDALLNVRPWGLNLLLWVGLLAGGLIAVYRATRIQSTLRFWAVLIAWIVTSALFSWRDADALRVFNLLAFGLLTGALLIEVQPRLSAPVDWMLSLATRLASMLWRGFDVIETWVRTRIPGSPER